MITNEQLAEWKGLAEKATPGPWSKRNKVGYVYSDDPQSSCVVAVCGDFLDKELTRFNGDRWNADGDFIAASREAIPALIAEIERLKAALEDMALQAGMRR